MFYAHSLLAKKNSAAELNEAGTISCSKSVLFGFLIVSFLLYESISSKSIISMLNVDPDLIVEMRTRLLMKKRQSRISCCALTSSVKN